MNSIRQNEASLSEEATPPTVANDQSDQGRVMLRGVPLSQVSEPVRSASPERGDSCWTAMTETAGELVEMPSKLWNMASSSKIEEHREDTRAYRDHWITNNRERYIASGLRAEFDAVVNAYNELITLPAYGFYAALEQKRESLSRALQTATDAMGRVLQDPLHPENVERAEARLAENRKGAYHISAAEANLLGIHPSEDARQPVREPLATPVDFKDIGDNTIPVVEAVYISSIQGMPLSEVSSPSRHEA